MPIKLPNLNYNQLKFCCNLQSFLIIYSQSDYIAKFSQLKRKHGDAHFVHWPMTIVSVNRSVKTKVNEKMTIGVLILINRRFSILWLLICQAFGPMQLMTQHMSVRINLQFFVTDFHACQWQKDLLKKFDSMLRRKEVGDNIYHPLVDIADCSRHMYIQLCEKSD